MALRSSYALETSLNQAIITVPIEESASGNRTIWTPASGKLFAVYGFWLKADNVVNVTWKSSTATSISGVLPLSIGEVLMAFSTSELPILKSRAKGDALVLNLSGAVGVHGWVNLVEQIA